MPASLNRRFRRLAPSNLVIGLDPSSRLLPSVVGNSGVSGFSRSFETLRYSSRISSYTAIVGLDGLGHLNENATVASSFTSMRQARREELYQSASNALAGVLAPWDRPGYCDGSVASSELRAGAKFAVNL